MARPTRNAVIRIGMVGFDHWYTATRVARTLAARDDVILAGIVDAELNKACDVARQVGVNRVGTQPTELVEDPSIDAICSFSNPADSPSVCVAAAKTGKHVMSIKPMARTLDQATEVVNAVHAAGVAFLPAESLGRSAPFYQRLREWIDEGRLGDILTATYSMWSPLPRSWPDADGPGWFADPDLTPGGAWIDHGIYHIDPLRWLLAAEVETVTGTCANVKYPELAVEDYGHATLRFDNQAVATVEDTWTATPGGGRTSMSLVGRDGSIVYDSITGRLSVTGASFSGDSPLFEGWAHLTPAPMPSDDALDTWLAAVRGDAEARSTLPGSVENSWVNLATCLAFYEAALSGLPVPPARLDTLPDTPPA